MSTRTREVMTRIPAPEDHRYGGRSRRLLGPSVARNRPAMRRRQKEECVRPMRIWATAWERAKSRSVVYHVVSLEAERLPLQAQLPSGCSREGCAASTESIRSGRLVGCFDVHDVPVRIEATRKA